RGGQSPWQGTPYSTGEPLALQEVLRRLARRRRRRRTVAADRALAPAEHRAGALVHPFGSTTVPVTGTSRASQVRDATITRQALAPGGASIGSHFSRSPLARPARHGPAS
ncbi:MAG: hypothetical protein MUF16_16315, partial [Burkholderiaceae bacterium]|nr:hypothetical protein [Burkholderiaceae bacterium]